MVDLDRFQPRSVAEEDAREELQREIVEGDPYSVEDCYEERIQNLQRLVGPLHQQIGYLEESLRVTKLEADRLRTENKKLKAYRGTIEREIKYVYAK